jgi:tRNA nucleotidyltransferase (CCA-adding enzyme)
MMASIKLAKQLIQAIKQQGYEAYLVGGAVRDHLLNRNFEDIDITTSAKPFHMLKLFDASPTGLKYGTVTVHFEQENFEVTTYRTDGPSEDQRHPDFVVYGTDEKEDVMRRDFTINGLLMDEHGTITDFIEGQTDLNLRLIRTIGDPILRFQEDALRMLRACYFVSKLNFSIEEETLHAIQSQASLIALVSEERILNEIIKLLKQDHVKKGLEALQKTHLDQSIPGLKKVNDFVLTLDEMPSIDVYFGLLTYLDIDASKLWKWTNKHRHKYEMAAKLAELSQPIHSKNMYDYGYDICLLGARLKKIIHGTLFKPTKLQLMAEQLPIKSVVDLKMKPEEMMALAHKKAGAWLKEVQQTMVELILKKQLDNSKEALFHYFRFVYLKQGEDKHGQSTRDR